MSMPMNVRPTNEYEKLENENRNMSEMVILKNKGVTPLELWMRNEYNAQPTLHGIIEPGKTMNVPKFIGETYARRNTNWVIEASSEPAVTAIIERTNEEIGNVEAEAHKQAIEVEANKVAQAKKAATKAKKEAEELLEETEEDAKEA